MGNPKRKAGRPKLRRPNTIRYLAPKDAEVYHVKRLYWALMVYEDQMVRDVKSVNLSDYMKLLKEYADMAGRLKEKGKIQYKYGNKVIEGMDEKGSTKGDTRSGSTQGTGKDGSTDMGAGVRATNPIT